MKLSDIHIRDPFILPYNGKYYMYGTRGDGCWDTCSGFDVYVSDDLENWSEPISVFEKSEGFWGEFEFWAPEVHHYNGKFYMFASFKSKNRNRATHILVSEQPDAIFHPVSDEPPTPKDWASLDGSLYVDKAGKPYMVFCHEWIQVKDGEMCAVQLSEDLSTSVGEPFVLFKASEPNWAIGYKENCYVTDGPFLYRTEQGRLLMIWSSLVGDKYVEAISYSDNGEINGNWKHSDELLFSENGGHGMIFESFEKEKYFVFHSPNITPNERPCLIKIAEKDNTLKTV